MVLASTSFLFLRVHPLTRGTGSLGPARSRYPGFTFSQSEIQSRSPASNCSSSRGRLQLWTDSGPLERAAYNPIKPLLNRLLANPLTMLRRNLIDT